jgi:hypothetical protein
MPDRQWRALENALAVHRDDRTPSVAQFLDEFGVSPEEKLRAVVAATGEPEQAAPATAVVTPRPEALEPAPRVIAMRTSPAGRARSSGLRTLFLLFALIALGAAAWYYRDALVVFGTDLMATVQTEMDRTRAADAPAATPAASPPLTQAPVVTDDAPATVVADGTGRTEVTRAPEPAAPAPEAPAPAASAPEPAPSPAEATTDSPPADVEPLPTTPEPVAKAKSPAPAESAPVAASAASPAPGPARFAFERDALSVREGDVAARIAIRRSGNLSGTVEVSWWTADGTAVADRDYADLGARIERFGPGESSRMIYVPLTNDAVPETARSFRVVLDGGTEIRVDIVDDD